MRNNIGITRVFKDIRRGGPVDGVEVNQYFSNEIYEGERVDSESDASYPIYDQDGVWQGGWDVSQFKIQGDIAVELLRRLTGTDAVLQLKRYFEAPVTPGLKRVGTDAVKGLIEVICFKLAKHKENLQGSNPSAVEVANQLFDLSIEPIVSAINNAQFLCEGGACTNLNIILESVEKALHKGPEEYVYYAKVELIRSIANEVISNNQALLDDRYPELSPKEQEGNIVHFVNELMMEVQDEYNIDVPRDDMAFLGNYEFSSFLNNKLSTLEGVNMLADFMAANVMSFMPKKERLSVEVNYGEVAQEISDALVLIPTTKQVNLSNILNDEGNDYLPNYEKIVKLFALQSLLDRGFVNPGSLSVAEKLFIAVAMKDKDEIISISQRSLFHHLESALSKVDEDGSCLLGCATQWGGVDLAIGMLRVYRSLRSQGDNSYRSAFNGPKDLVYSLFDEMVKVGKGSDVSAIIELARAMSILDGCLLGPVEDGSRNAVITASGGPNGKIEAVINLMSAADEVGIVPELFDMHDSLGNNLLFYVMRRNDRDLANSVIAMMLNRMTDDQCDKALLGCNIDGYNILTNAIESGSYNFLSVMAENFNDDYIERYLKEADGRGVSSFDQMMENTEMFDLLMKDPIYQKVMLGVLDGGDLAAGIMRLIEKGDDVAPLLFLLDGEFKDKGDQIYGFKYNGESLLSCLLSNTPDDDLEEISLASYPLSALVRMNVLQGYIERFEAPDVDKMMIAAASSGADLLGSVVRAIKRSPVFEAYYESEGFDPLPFYVGKCLDRMDARCEWAGMQLYRALQVAANLHLIEDVINVISKYSMFEENMYSVLHNAIQLQEVSLIQQVITLLPKYTKMEDVILKGYVEGIKVVDSIICASPEVYNSIINNILEFVEHDNLLAAVRSLHVSVDKSIRFGLLDSECYQKVRCEELVSALDIEVSFQGALDLRGDCSADASVGESAATDNEGVSSELDEGQSEGGENKRRRAYDELENIPALANAVAYDVDLPVPSSGTKGQKIQTVVTQFFSPISVADISAQLCDISISDCAIATNLEGRYRNSQEHEEISRGL